MPPAGPSENEQVYSLIVVKGWHDASEHPETHTGSVT